LEPISLPEAGKRVAVQTPPLSKDIRTRIPRSLSGDVRKRLGPQIPPLGDAETHIQSDVGKRIVLQNMLFSTKMGAAPVIIILLLMIVLSLYMITLSSEPSKLSTPKLSHANRRRGTNQNGSRILTKDKNVVSRAPRNQSIKFKSS
jgi:hypothetical protein